MSVKDIEQAIMQLPTDEVAELSHWFEEFQSQKWDEQIESDSKAGKFAALIEQAKVEYTNGQCKPL